MFYYRHLLSLLCFILTIPLTAQNEQNQVSQSPTYSEITPKPYSISAQDSRSETSRAMSIPSGTIEISKSLYDVILDWIPLGEETTLDSYLLNNYDNPAEVHAFLVQYYSGTSNKLYNGGDKGKGAAESGSGGSSSGAGNSSECTCKNIMPIDGASASILPAYSDDKILDEDWNGQYHAWWYWKGDGCAHDFTMDGSGNDIWEGDNQERNGYYQKIEILNLCSEEGMRSETCNCDKVMYTDGEYHKRYHLFTDEAGIAEIEAKFMESFYAFTAERDVLVDRNDFMNMEEIASASIEMGASISRSIDWGELKNALENLYDAVIAIGDGDYSTAIGSSVDFLQSASNTVNREVENGGLHQEDKFIDISYQPILHANIPRVFVYASNIAGHINGSGNEYRGEIRFSSNFYLNWQVPTQDAGYIPGQEVPSDLHEGECCNENIGKWLTRGSMVHYNWPNQNSREDAIKNQIKANLNTNMQGATKWNYASGATLNGNIIGSIDNPFGHVYSEFQCGNCRDLQWGDRGDGIPNFWIPIFSKEGSLCDGQAVDVYIGNLNDLPDPSVITVKIYRLDANGNYQLYQTLSSAQSPMSFWDDGFYKIVFITNEGCKTLEFVNIPPCDDNNPGDMSCYEDNLSISPNPIYVSGEGGFNEEYFRVSWDYEACPEPDYKFPMHIYVYQMSGNNIYTSAAPIYTQSSFVQIPTSIFPGTGSYIVRLQFADGTFVTKLLQVL